VSPGETNQLLEVMKKWVNSKPLVVIVTSDTNTESETKIMHPAPFSPPLGPRDIGPVYEVRTDTYRPGRLADIIKLYGDMFRDGVPPRIANEAERQQILVDNPARIFGFA
jgi:hypothetical protein